MNLWIFHHYATLPSLNGHIRPFRFAQHLKDHGTNTTIFAASYQHFAGINLITDKKRYIRDDTTGTPFVFVRTPDGSSGIARIKNMLSFFCGLVRISRNYTDEYGKPDCILASSPQPFAMIAGIKVAKKFGIPCICEIRDLWPEAVFNVSKKVSENTIVGRVLIACEHWTYKHADALIFTKEGDTDYLKERKWTIEQGGDIALSKCFYINNGIELSEYLGDISNCKIEDSDLEDTSFKLVYAGAIRPVNNVGNIIDAAKYIPKDENIKILVYGEGSQKSELEKRVENEGIDNVIFKGFVEKKYLPYILSKSSVNLLNYSGDKYNWTRGVSSNKLFEYLASGKPVISTMKPGYSIVEKYKCGIELSKQTPDELAKAILQMKNLDCKEYKALCNNSLAAARNFDYAVLTKRLEDVLRFVEAQEV